MQAIYRNQEKGLYSGDMPGGRPAKFKRTKFGERLCRLRQERGLSQCKVAEILEITQQTYAGWERSTTALRPSEIVKVAQAFKITTDELLGNQSVKKRGSGPAGRARKVFEDVSKLSRAQQRKVLDTVETLVAGQLAQSNSTS